MAKRSIPTLALAIILALAGVTQAQSLNDQLLVLTGHVEDEADRAAEDPSSFASNATNASWQGDQVNFTRAWTCETATVANAEAGMALGELGLCPALPAETAAEQEALDEQDVNDTAVAEAEELGNDTGTALEDEAAALDAFLTNVTEDPTQAPGALEAFANRTLAFVRTLLGLPGRAIDVVGSAIASLADTLVALGGTIGGAIGDAVVTVARAIGELGADLAGAVRDAWTGTQDAGAQAFDEASTAVADGLRAVGELATSTLSAVVDAVKELVPGGKDLPTRGERDLARGAGDMVRGLGDGFGLPVDL